METPIEVMLCSGINFLRNFCIHTIWKLGSLSDEMMASYIDISILLYSNFKVTTFGTILCFMKPIQDEKSCIVLQRNDIDNQIKLENMRLILIRISIMNNFCMASNCIYYGFGNTTITRKKDKQKTAYISHVFSLLNIFNLRLMCKYLHAFPRLT